MKNAIIFGFGKIGSVLSQKLPKLGVNIKYLVRTSGIFDSGLHKISNLDNWRNYIKEPDIAFICIPTFGSGEKAFKYASAFLEQSKPVITCEKASVAYHWSELISYNDIFKYTATVGGGTKMLKVLDNYKPDDIIEIKAVINGTLNYISDNLKLGKSKEMIINEAIAAGYTEPGVFSVSEVIRVELRDVVLKTIIIANHLGMFERVIGEKDIEVVNDIDNTITTKRCIIKITKDIIKVGFIEDNKSSWLPKGVNNTLYVNGEKMVYGPGAGAEATVSTMIDDLYSLQQLIV